MVLRVQAGSAVLESPATGQENIWVERVMARLPGDGGHIESQRVLLLSN